MLNALLMEVEDNNNDIIYLNLYNQVPRENTLSEIQQIFAPGSEIVVKQPFKKISYQGITTLRNDNPSNIIFSDS
jgi:hypothetical protein